MDEAFCRCATQPYRLCHLVVAESTTVGLLHFPETVPDKHPVAILRMQSAFIG